MIFGNRAGTVGGQKHQQIVHPILQLPAFVGFADLHPVLQLVEDKALVGNIVIFVDGVILAGEGLVGNHPEMPGIEDQGIAGDAGGGLVGLAEAAVDDDQLTAALDGAFIFLLQQQFY